MATNRIQTGLRLNEAVYEKAKVIAAKQKRSLNNFIECIIEEYIADYEAKDSEIEVLDELNEETIEE